MSPEEDDGWESAICGGWGWRDRRRLGRPARSRINPRATPRPKSRVNPAPGGEKICPRAGFPVRSPHTCGNLAFHATSQRNPSGSAKYPAYPPQSVAWPGLTIRPPPASPACRGGAGLEDPPAPALRLGEERVYLFYGADVVGEREPREAAPLGG